jgi:hypothetical protein
MMGTLLYHFANVATSSETAKGIADFLLLYYEKTSRRGCWEVMTGAPILMDAGALYI